MHEQTVYCIDTSALIDLKLLYRMKTFPSLWCNLSDLIKDDRLISSRQVLEELKKKDDELLCWARKSTKMFKVEDRDQINTAQEILRRFRDLVDPNKQIPDADPFVIALAVVKNRQISLFGEKCIVVTQEKRAGAGGRPRMPDVCSVYGIECFYGSTALAEFFEREGWEF
jgi:rRNA maturation endonuclease Nob1